MKTMSNDNIDINHSGTKFLTCCIIILFDTYTHNLLYCFFLQKKQYNKFLNIDVPLAYLIFFVFFS